MEERVEGESGGESRGGEWRGRVEERVEGESGGESGGESRGGEWRRE